MKSSEVLPPRRMVRHCTDQPLGRITVGDRHVDFAPQAATSSEVQRRRRTEDVVHGGQW